MKKALYMLSEFSDQDFAWLLNAGEKLQLSPGATLIQEGEPTDSFYLVLEGALGVCLEAFGGKEIARLEDGEVVGEMSFVDSHLPAATVKAIDHVTVWAVPRKQLSTHLAQDVDFAAHFYCAIATFLSDRLRDTISRLSQNTSSDVAGATLPTLTPQIARQLEIAKTRLNWLLHQFKEVSS